MPVEEIIVGRDPQDIKKYEKTGTMFIGKHVVGKGYESHLTNPVLMDVLRPHIMLIVGKRGSGKSYTGAVIAEEIMDLPEDVKKNLSVLMIDTMGIYWSMKNVNEKDIDILSAWELKPKAFVTNNIIPAGLVSMYDKAGISYDGTFAIKPSELSSGDWALTFGFTLIDALGILLERMIKKMEGKDYSISDIIDEIEKDERSEPKERMALQNRFLAAQGWGIFSDKATKVEDILQAGQATVLDVSMMDWNVRNLMVGVLSRELYQARVTARRAEEMGMMGGETIERIPMTWLIMDEAHNFLPSEGETAATHGLIVLVTMGRQPGISCVFITQRPNKLHETAIAQADLVISHRLTAKPDLDALSAIMQTYMLEDIRKSITNLPKTKGSALVLDDNSERLFNIQIRPRYSWHAGGSPLAMAEKI